MLIHQASRLTQPCWQWRSSAIPIHGSASALSEVGIDTILSESGCAKASLYSNFNSKADLAIVFLDRREGDAKLREPEKFAQVRHMLMKGSIVSAGEGSRTPRARRSTLRGLFSKAGSAMANVAFRETGDRVVFERHYGRQADLRR